MSINVIQLSKKALKFYVEQLELKFSSINNLSGTWNSYILANVNDDTCFLDLENNNSNYSPKMNEVIFRCSIRNSKPMVMLYEAGSGVNK